MHGLDFVPETGALLSAGADATLRRFDRAGNETTLRSFDRPALAVFALPRARVAAVEEGRVHVYDTASGWEVTSLPLPPPQGWRVGAVVGPPGRGLVAAGGASAIEVVDLGSGARRSFPVPRREEAFAFSPDGRVLATLREESEPLALVLRDAETGRELAVVPHNRSGPYPFHCRSSDGSYFGFNGTLFRLGSDAKALLESLGWPRSARLCAVSPDGRYVASAANEDAIEVRERVRNSAGRSELRRLGELLGHRGLVTSLAFAPDSRTLASGGADTSILLWDIQSLESPAEAPTRPAPHAAPRLALTFDDGIEGPGVAPVRAPADSPLQLVAGRIGRALQPRAPLAFPEARTIVLGDEFTLTLFFRVETAGLGPGVHQALTSELATLDVRDGGTAYLSSTS